MKKFLLLACSTLLVVPAASILGNAKLPVKSKPLTFLQQPVEPKSQTFTGTIIRDGNHFILSDSANKLSYALDDGKKASEYEGKKVKVTGTMDATGSTIHVTTIEEIAEGMRRTP